eukprot:UN05062
MQQIAEDIVEIKEAHESLHELVIEQGQQIALVNENTEQAKEHLEQANEELIIAERNKKKARKRKCCFLLILVAMFAMVFGLMGISGSFKKN